MPVSLPIGLDEVADRLVVEPAEMLHQRPRLTIAYYSAIYVAHWNQPRERAGDKSLVGVINVGEGKILLVDRNALVAAQLHDFPARDAVHAVLPGRCPDLAATHDEEV